MDQISLNNIDRAVHEPGFLNAQPESLSNLLSHLPYYALLLDKNRRIIVSNANFLKDNDAINTRDLFGKGPGDLFQCVNAAEAGCGNSPNCRFCGIYQTLTECQKKNTVVSNPCKIMVQKDSFIKAYEFMARCSPINLVGQHFFLLTLTDVSADSRKNNLERIFFHDVLNIINGLKGLAQIIKETNQQEMMNEYISMLLKIIDNLTETIAIQRDLINAEKRELIVNNKQVSVKEIVETVRENSFFEGKTDKMEIKTRLDNPEYQFNTDPVLLIRVLINMVKNAFEASAQIPPVTLGSYVTDGHVAFYVHNMAHIGENAARYIFQPMFSTKGNNRGLGTYSMKLIGENYLKGKVWFKTHPEVGTTFTIELPAHCNN